MIDDDEELTEEAWFTGARTLVEQWFDLEDPTRLEPAARELYVETEIDGLTLRGYVDRLDVAPDGAMRVVDYKTGRSPSELFEAKALFQMKFYALVLWRIHGEIPKQLQLVYLGNSEVVRYTPDEHDLLAIERNVRAIWDAVVRAAQTGDWRPRTSRLCDWCDFRDLCPAWGGTPPPLPERRRVHRPRPREQRRGRSRRRVTRDAPRPTGCGGACSAADGRPGVLPQRLGRDPGEGVEVDGAGLLRHRRRRAGRRSSGPRRRRPTAPRWASPRWRRSPPARPRAAARPPGRARGAACRGRPRRR